MTPEFAIFDCVQTLVAFDPSAPDDDEFKFNLYVNWIGIHKDIKVKD